VVPEIRTKVESGGEASARKHVAGDEQRLWKCGKGVGNKTKTAESGKKGLNRPLKAKEKNGQIQNYVKKPGAAGDKFLSKV